jgi:hypothetical protein
MSAGPGGYAYSQARLQARLGARADNPDLQRAHAARDLSAFLQLVRGTSHARYVARIAPDSGVHEAERRLREEWHAAVEEVARWQPAAAQATVRWLRWLPYLPALQKLARGGRPPAWTRDDPVLGRIVATEPAQRATALLGTPLAPLSMALATHGGVMAAWAAHWRSLWPAAERERKGLEQLAVAVESLDTALRAAPASAASGEACVTLARRALRSFRAHPLSSGAAVAYLALVALDLLALRGAVARRASLAPKVLS